MSFGERLAEARKKKQLSQTDVAKKMGTKAPVISRYERGEAKPSIEAAAKLAEILTISLDYLVGNTNDNLDSDTMQRVIELNLLPEEIKEKLYYFIDMTIRDHKAKQAYS